MLRQCMFGFIMKKCRHENIRKIKDMPEDHMLRRCLDACKSEILVPMIEYEEGPCGIYRFAGPAYNQKDAYPRRILS